MGSLDTNAIAARSQSDGSGRGASATLGECMASSTRRYLADLNGTPCREGLPWIVQMLAAIENGRGRMEDLDVLAEMCRKLGPGNTFCALAPGAVEPLQSALKYFREDFVRHIRDGHCPWK